MDLFYPGIHPSPPQYGEKFPFLPQNLTPFENHGDYGNPFRNYRNQQDGILQHVSFDTAYLDAFLLIPPSCRAFDLSTDLTINCDGGCFKVHRAIVCGQSNFFENTVKKNTFLVS